MTDIVARINHGIGDGWKALAKEAAAEIERLQAAEDHDLRCKKSLRAEIERLQRFISGPRKHPIFDGAVTLEEETLDAFISRALEPKP